MSSRRQIGIASSPNSQRDDLKAAWKSLLAPWSWRGGKDTQLLEKAFLERFGASEAVSFSSGRVALYEILKSLGIGADDEVIMQAFSCVVVPNSIIWAGATPIYVDIRDDFNLDPSKLEKKITKKTKAIIVQHTFGIPADIEEIARIAKKHHLILIEDCAHLILTKKGGKLLGTFGDVAFFSFGQEKAISSVHGGLVITNNPRLGEKLRSIQHLLNFPSELDVARTLLHPLLWSLVLPTYYFFNFGKAILWLSYRFRLTSSFISPAEIKSRKPHHFEERLPSPQAKLALRQLQKAGKFNQQRLELARIYRRELKNLGLMLPSDTTHPLLRLPILTTSPAKLREFARRRRIILGNWYDAPIYPQGSNLEVLGYKSGSCPKAEELSSRVVNLPLSPTMSREDVLRVVMVVKKYLEQV